MEFKYFYSDSNKNSPCKNLNGFIFGDLLDYETVLTLEGSVI